MLLDTVEPTLSGDTSALIESAWARLFPWVMTTGPARSELVNRNLPTLLTTRDGALYLGEID